MIGALQVRVWSDDEAAAVAREHFLADLTSEGRRDDRDLFPKDEADFVKVGLW
jgi:hypothetical protein